MSGFVHKDVSVIIPCYNQSEFVQDAVQSVLDNSIRPCDILVLLMDEKSWELRSTLEGLSPIVRCSISKRQSLPAARNSMIRRLGTNYVIPLDADDKLPPNFIRQVLRSLPADAVYVKSHTFGDIDEIWDNPNEVTLDWLKDDNRIPNTALIKVDAWRAVGGYNENFSFGYEDWEFWLHICKRKFVFKKCHNTHLLYRRHGKTLLHEGISRRDEIRKMIRETHPDVYETTRLSAPPKTLIPRKRETASLPQKTPDTSQQNKRGIFTTRTVSIIIPCYGYADYVEEAVKSAIAQTRPVQEVLVLLMDERSRARKEDLEKLEKNVQAIPSTQKALPSARNVLIGISTSEYFIPLDADDTLPPAFVEQTLQYATNDVDVVYVGAKYFGAEQGTWPRSIDEEADWDLLTTFRHSVFVCTALVKKSAWANVGGYNDNLRAYEDMEFWLHLYSTGHVFRKCATTHLNYRKHAQTSMLWEHNSDTRKQQHLRSTIMSIHSERYTRIPKIIHYVWMGNKERPDAFIDTWKKHLGPDWIFKEWNEKTFYIDSIPFLRQAYDAKKFGIAVDPIRATVLYQFGGVWMDTDVVMSRDISPFLQYDFFASYESEYWLNVGTMGARPGLQMFKNLIDMYQTAALPETSDEFVQQIGTGPITITKELQKTTSWNADGHAKTLHYAGDRYRLESPAVFVLNDERSGAINFTQHLYHASWMDAPVSKWSETVREGYEQWKKRNAITRWRG